MHNSLSLIAVRALLLGLAFGGTGLAAHAQTAPTQIKTKTKTAVDGAASTKSKTKGKAALPAQAGPRPTSPVASSPQVVLGAPASAMQVAPAPVETPPASQEGWLTDLAAAQAQAKATNRPLVAVFSGSDWCKPCIIFEQEVFAKPEFAAFAKGRLVLAHFDFPRLKKNQPTAAQLKLNEAAAAQLNREGDFPLAVVIAPDGKVLAKTGYIAGGPDAFENYLKKVIPTL